MPSTIAYNFGDVVLVPFPFTNQTASKTRPAVVVSSSTYNGQRPDMVVMAITSQLLRPAGTVGEVLLADWSRAGLPKPPLAKPVVATLEQALVLRKLGTLQQADLQSVRQALRQIIGSRVMPRRGRRRGAGASP